MIEKRRFRFWRSRMSYFKALIFALALVAIGLWLSTYYDGDYISAWYTATIAAVVILLALSIPRSIILFDKGLVISCLLEERIIYRSDIKSIRKISPRRMRALFPIFAGYGFLGYYGRFFDFKGFDVIRVYVTEWRYLVEIETIYDDRYYLSCRQRDELIEHMVKK